MKTFLTILLTVLFLFGAIVNIFWITEGIKSVPKDNREIFISITAVVGILVGAGIAIKESVKSKNNDLGECVGALIGGIVTGGIIGGFVFGLLLMLFFPIIIWLLIYYVIIYAYEKNAEIVEMVIYLIGCFIFFICPFYCAKKHSGNTENEKLTPVLNEAHLPYYKRVGNQFIYIER